MFSQAIPNIVKTKIDFKEMNLCLSVLCVLSRKDLSEAGPNLKMSVDSLKS